MNPRDRFARTALLVCIVPPAVFALLSAWWSWRCPPSMVYLGYLQGDQPTYTALARAVFDRGNGLFYANPFDFDPAAPRVLTNLGYIALGWAMRVVGQKPVLVWELWRIGFGVLCYCLFAALVARFFCSAYMRWWVFLAGVFGGGVAWLVAINTPGMPGWVGFIGRFAFVEGGYDWWCLNLFRQSIYPLELLYHSCFFAAILSYLDRRYVRLLAIMFVLWWTHVVTAILATTIIGLALAIDLLRRTGAGDTAGRRERFVLVALGAVACSWLAYYGLFLPRFPSIRSWIEQTLSFEMNMAPSVWPRAWGLLLLGPVAALFCSPLRRYLSGDRTGRLILLWGLAAFAWSHNNLVLSRPIQPMHFARGYIYLFLLVLSAKAVDLLLNRRDAEGTEESFSPRSLRLCGEDIPSASPGPSARKRATAAWVAFGLLPLLMADNVLFVFRVATEIPQPGLLTVSREAKQVLDYFRDQPESLRVLSMDLRLGVLMTAHTRHRVFASERVFTPFFDKRHMECFHMVRTRDPSLSRRHGVERIILQKEFVLLWADWATDPTRFRVLLDNPLYVVGEVVEGSTALPTKPVRRF